MRAPAYEAYLGAPLTQAWIEPMALGVMGYAFSGLWLTNDTDLQDSDADPVGERSKDDRSDQPV